MKGSHFVVFFLAGIASAQFQFFENIFGHSHQHQQQQEERTGAAQYTAQVDAVTCSTYLCPVTLDCVDSPTDCPCPNEEDVKCIIPDLDDNSAARDGTVLCVRGSQGCTQVERLLHTTRTRT